MTTTKSPTYLLVQEKVGQDTIEWLQEQRDVGDSWRLISLRLLSDHNLNVTEVTLRTWWDKAHPKEEVAEETPAPEATEEPAVG